jgi:ornithine carbamoyltransferase
VGTYQLGGHALFLSPRDVQLGRGEPIADTARVLSRYVNGIMIRTFAHQDVEELAKFADVPVINGLTDLLHPCQILADLLTVRQHLGTWEGRKVAWIGDGNNMANSWINAAYRLGFELSLACPEGYEPADHLLARAKEKAKITLTRDPKEAIAGAHVVNTDVWASMGQEDEQKKREKDFAGYTVNKSMMDRAAKDAIFLHCLPAHRGEEVAADVIDGPQSRVWDEAENRLHVQKAIMAVLMGGEKLA